MILYIYIYIYILKKQKKDLQWSPKHQTSSEWTANPILKTKQNHLPQTNKLHQERGAYKLSSKYITLHLED